MIWSLSPEGLTPWLESASLAVIGPPPRDPEDDDDEDEEEDDHDEGEDGPPVVREPDPED